MRSVEVKRVWNSAGLINNCKQAKGESMAAFFEEEKEVTETVEEPQKTVEAAKKRQRQLIQSRRQRSSVRLVAERSIRNRGKNKYVCYECGNYFRVRTKNRIRMVADKDTFEPWFEELESKIRLIFRDIRRRSKPHRKRQDCMRQSQSENAGSMDLRR